MKKSALVKALIILPLLAALALAGCGAAAPPPATGELTRRDARAYFAPEHYPLPQEEVRLLAAAGAGQGLYYALPDQVCLWEREAGGRPLFYIEAADEQHTWVGLATGPEDSLWLWERLDTLAGAEGHLELGQSRSLLRRADASGQILAELELDIPGPVDRGLLAGPVAADGQGRLYLLDGADRVHILDADGQEQAVLESRDQLLYLLALADGRLGAVADTPGGHYFRLLDTDKQSWGGEYPLPRGVLQFQAGREYDLLYTQDGELYGHDLGSSETVRILEWLDCGLTASRVAYVSQLDQDRFLCLTRLRRAEGTEQEFVLLTRSPDSQRPQKTVLTLGAALFPAAPLEEAIAAFNASDPYCRVELVNYFDRAADPALAVAVQRLNTDLIVGNIPDMLALDNLPWESYAPEGLLADLSPYLDGGGSISRLDLVPAVLAVMEEEGGGLYGLPLGFSIDTAVGLRAVVGKSPGWTVAEFLELLAQNPGVGQPIALTEKTDLLWRLTAAGLPGYIDWHTGQCRFDSQEFISLLELAAALPAEIDWQDPDLPEWGGLLLARGQALLSPELIGSFEDLAQLEAMSGGPVTLKGYPADQGLGSSMLLHSSLAVTEACADKEEAWRFISFLLSREYQSQAGAVKGFPVNRAALEQERSAALSRATDRTWYAGEEAPVLVAPVTEEQTRLIQELIDATAARQGAEQIVLDIIREEAAPFFAGQGSAEQGAERIQSRVSLYVNEQR